MYIIDMGGFLAAEPAPYESPSGSIAALVASAVGYEGRKQWGQALLSGWEEGSAW